MRDSPSACVADACVIIDLREGGLLPRALRRPFQLIAADFVVAELRNPGREALIRDGLVEETLTSDEMQELADFKARYPSDLSVNDLSALLVAKRTGLILLTNERLLREAAQAEGVEVRSIVWLLDQMVRREVLARDKAVAVVRRLRTAGRMRAPMAERLINEWRKR